MNFDHLKKIGRLSTFFGILIFFMGFGTLSAHAATFDQSGCNAAQVLPKFKQVTYYDVGPGKPYTSFSQLPWSQLGGCVTVRVYPKANNEPYHEMVLISAGTDLSPSAPDKWFRLQGMPDVDGNLPIISGENATQQETIKVNGVDTVRSLQYVDNNNVGNDRSTYKDGLVMVFAQFGRDYGTTAENIMIDHFVIQKAYKDYSFMDEKKHLLTQYPPFASGIYGIAKHLIIKDNIITDNGIGLFQNSLNSFDGTTSEDLLIEGNSFTKNGVVNSFFEHHIYVQTMGPEIVQYNYFGMGRPGSHPQGYKTRSAGSVFRYNTMVFDPAQNNDPCMVNNVKCGIQQAIWYSEPDGSPDLIKPAPNYHQAYVYGNTFIDKADGQGLIWTDREANDMVYFYNNTVLVKRPKPQQQVLLFMNPFGVKVEARNNIFASEPFANGILPVPLVFEGSETLGSVNLVNNVVTTKTLSFWPWHHGPKATSTITGLASNIIIPNNNNGLVFNDLANLDLHLKAGSPAINVSAPLDPVALANGQLVTEQYVSLGVSEPRIDSLDAGAFDFTGQSAPVPPVISVFTPIPASDVDTTPSFTFNSTKAGTLQFVGAGCQAANLAQNAAVQAGNTTITFGPLVVGNYSNCSITVTDANDLTSNLLPIGNFQITAPNAPVLSVFTPIPASDVDTTPSFTFNSTKAGTLQFVGAGCQAANLAQNAAVPVGHTTITFGPLAIGNYSNCSITVTDANNLISNLLPIGNFQIVAPGAPVSPILSVVTAIPASDADTTPSFTFNSTKAGTLQFLGEGCQVSNFDDDAPVPAGHTTIIFGPLELGDYSDCSINVTDADDLISNLLPIGNFTITAPIQVQGGGGGGGGSGSGGAGGGLIIAPPVLLMITPIPTSTSDTTPSFTFNTNKAGTLKYHDCPVAVPANNTQVTTGDHLVTFGPLTVGSYVGCSITVTDDSNLVSAPLAVGTFQISGTGSTDQTVTHLPSLPLVPFSDTQDHWAKKYISQIQKDCSVKGYTDASGNSLHLFKPDQPITRAELLTIIMRCKFPSLPTYTKSRFTDVPSNYFALPFIEKGAEEGFVEGYPGKLFKPNKNSNRAEALAMILRVFIGKDEAVKAPKNNQCSDLTDSWYMPFFNFALNMGMISGYVDASGHPLGLCRPATNITRAEVAKIVSMAMTQAVK